MMKLKEVGRVPEDQIAIQRMVVSTCPSSHFYQLSFHQCLLRFFLNRFLGHSGTSLMMMMTPLRRTSDSSSSNSELFDEVEFLSEEMCENRSPECSMDEEESVSC